MDTNANNNRESFEDQQVIFVDTHLIQKAVEGLQRAREEFQTLLEQAEGGDASVYYDLGVRYTEGDGTDKDPAQAARWFALASEDGDLRATDLLILPFFEQQSIYFPKKCPHVLYHEMPAN